MSNERGRPRNWDGKSNDKRQRELRAAKAREGGYREVRDTKRQGNVLDLSRVSKRINELCTVLEDVHFEDYDFTDAADVALWDISQVHDDLISLGEWHDRALSSVQHWLADNNVRGKIAKLRQTDGRTPEEAATALMLADKLERKLGAVLAMNPAPLPAARPFTPAAPVTPAVTLRLCGCGCGEPVVSPRPEARYATPACRVRAHRAARQATS